MHTPLHHDPYAALRLPDFRRYFIGNMTLNLAWQMQRIAIGWEIYERTGSAFHLGFAGLVQYLPVVAFSLIAGHVTDSFNRKRVLLAAIGANVVTALALAVNSAAGGSLLILYCCLLALGTARTFVSPIRHAFLPQIVPMHIFSNAASWNSSMFEVATMSGPAIGGILIGFFGNATLTYVIAALGALTFFILGMGIHYSPQVQERPSVTMDSLSAGVRFVWRKKIILSAILLDMFAVLLGGATALMPIYAKDILQVGPRGLGWLMAAPSIGAVTMALLQAHHGPMARAGRTLLGAVAGFGFVTIVFGISTNFWLSIGMLFLLGACDNLSVVIRNTVVQLLTPDEMRGRVSALNALFIGTSNELGAFESGLVAGFFGPVVSVVSGGIGTIAVVVTIAWLFPQLRRYGRLASDGH